MSDSADLSFNAYVERRDDAVFGGTEEGSRYAFGGDLQMLRAFRKAKPLELAVSSLVRGSKTLLRNQYLGTTVRVGPKQLPRIYNLAKECAHELGVPMPTVYVANNPFMNAYTYGTDEDSFIVIHSKLIDDFDDDELKFVIGHEMGHIQNKHVVYMTALRLLTFQRNMLMSLLSPFIKAGLMAWSRRAEITCDRAGALCARDVDVAQRAFLKMACGSSKLYDELNIDAYLEQFDEGQKGVGRLTEITASHPYLPKRMKALQLFEESDVYRASQGLAGGRPLAEVDADIAKFIQVMGKKDAKEAPAPSNSQS
ncbi:MAG: M48 family metallopeptidase [Myxococcota bacterium]